MSGEFGGCIVKLMSQPRAEYSPSRSVILLHSFPGVGWGFALSSWILIFFVSHVGHFSTMAGRRLLRYIVIVSFLFTL